MAWLIALVVAPILFMLIGAYLVVTMLARSGPISTPGRLVVPR